MISRGTRSPRNTWRAGAPAALAGFSPGAPPSSELAATEIVSTTGTGVSAQTWQSTVVMTNL